MWRGIRSQEIQLGPWKRVCADPGLSFGSSMCELMEKQRDREMMSWEGDLKVGGGGGGVGDRGGGFFCRV